MRTINHRAFPILSLTLLVLVAGCASRSQSSHGAKDQIVLSSGGGFSGMYTGYTIRGDGQVLRWEIPPGGTDVPPRHIFTLSPDSTDDCFGQLEAMQFRTISFNSPGNMTYSVEQKRGDSSHIVRWGDERSRPPAAVTTFYSSMMEMIQRRTATR